MASLGFQVDQSKWDLRSIPIEHVRESSEKLRDVNREGEEYLLLRDSIALKGILMPVLVREQHDPVTKKTIFGLVDGLQRFTACSELGMKFIPANVVNMNDSEVFEAQLIANAKKVETKPAQFAEHLARIIGQNPTMTRQELAESLAISKPWIDQLLHLTKLVPNVAGLVDEGKITISNALALAKLPEEEQVENVDIAQTMSPQEFAGRITARIKEIREAQRKGKDPAAAVWSPHPFAKKWPVIKAEFEEPKARDAVLKATEAKTAEEGWQAAIAWVANMDPLSIQNERQKEESRKVKAAEAAEKRKKEREDLKASLAAKSKVEMMEPAQATA